MARVQTVAAARASTKPRICRQCQHEIQTGEPYKFVAKKTGPRSSVRLIWCREHFPKQSDLLSGRASDFARITEGFDEAKKDSLTGMQSALSNLSEDIREFAQDIKDSADSIEQGFGHPTAQSESMSNTADELEQWADRLQNHADDCPENRGDLECPQCKEKVQPNENGDCPECDNSILPPGEFTESEQEWFDEADSIASEAPELELQG